MIAIAATVLNALWQAVAVDFIMTLVFSPRRSLVQDGQRSLALAGDERGTSNPASSPLRCERGLECQLLTIACLC